MTSRERKELRYQRRQEKRKEKRKALIESIGSAEEVFNFHDMFVFGEQCCRGVMWKQSTQNFHRHLFSRTAMNRKRALNNYKMKRLVRFSINERGKTRMIEAPHIDDRQIHKTLTQKVLLPLYEPRLIYDNGASLKKKGLKFSQDYFDSRLRRHIRKYGMAGWVIIADFKGFFPNADRNIVKAKHAEIKDDIIRSIADKVTDAGYGDRGLPLGVEPSQIEMIALPSSIDSYMNCQCRVCTGHYMDDYHIIVPPHIDPNDAMLKFSRKAKEYGIIVSKNKTQIIPFGKPLKFCKSKRVFYGISIVRSGCRESVKRCRRKIAKFSRSDMKYEDIYTSVTSSLSYLQITRNHKRVLKLKRFFYARFGFSCEKIEEFRRKDAVYNTQKVS